MKPLRSIALAMTIAVGMTTVSCIDAPSKNENTPKIENTEFKSGPTIQPTYEIGIVENVTHNSYVVSNTAKRTGVGVAAGVASHLLLGTGFTKSIVTGGAIGAATSGDKLITKTEVQVFNPISKRRLILEYNSNISFPVGDTIQYQSYNVKYNL